MDPGESLGRSRADRRPRPFLLRQARRRPLARSAAIPRPLATSATFSPAVIEDIQIKAELARYRIRGFGALRRANLGHV